MNKSLNIDTAAMHNQMTPEMRTLLEDILQNGRAASLKPQDKDYSSLEKRDVSCVTSEEDYKEERMYLKLYGGLYEDIAGGVVARSDISTVEYMLEEKAKEIKGAGLQRLFRKKCTETKRRMKAEYEQAKRDNERAAQELEEERRKLWLEQGNKTKFTDLPEECQNMYIGPGWVADDDGIYLLEDNGKTTRKIEASRFPFLIECLYKPYDAGAIGNEKCGIRYKSIQGDWRKRIVEQSILMNAQKVLELTKMGVSVNSRRALTFTDYATSLIEESTLRGALPVHKMSSTFGWTSDGKEFLPFTGDEFVFENADKFPGLAEALTESKGRAEDWYREYKEMRKTRVKMFHFATIVLLASPIIGMLPDVTNGFVGNVYGDTHTGKSINDQIAATMWGNYNSCYIVSPKGTFTGMEVRMNALKNIPLVVEDANNADENTIPPFIMQASNGIGALRGNKDLGNRAQMSWRMAVLANSESILTSYGNNGNANGGMHTRVYAVKSGDAFPEVWKEKIGYWKQFFAGNYGHAGRDFVKILQDMGVEKIQKLKSGFLKKILKRTEELKHSQTQAEGLAILMTADYLAAKKLFKDDIMFTMDEMISFTAEEETIKPAKRFYTKIEDKMSGYPERFEGMLKNLTKAQADDDSPVEWKGEFWGIYAERDSERWLEIRPEILDKWLREGGVDKGLFFDYLRGHHLLDSDEGCNTRKIWSRTQKRRMRLVKIKLDSSINAGGCEGEDDDLPKQEAQPVSEEDRQEGIKAFLDAADDINDRKQMESEEDSEIEFI